MLADRDDALPLQQWLGAKRAATDALLAAGGTLTHHHAVGADHRPWLEHEGRPAGRRGAPAVKQRLDPEGICNPGVLLPDYARGVPIARFPRNRHSATSLRRRGRS